MLLLVNVSRIITGEDRSLIFYLAAREFFLYKPGALSLSVNGKKSTLSPFMIAVANAQQYGNDAKIAPDAKMDDGLLNVVVIHKLTLPGLCSAIPRLFWGNIKNLGNVSVYETNEISIRRDYDSLVNIDGEVFEEDAELRISVLPRALKVLAPRDSGAHSQ